MTDVRLADPAVVVLVGAAGSGKSRWAAERFRVSEIVSSDALRAVVGSGPADLDASVDAFALLDQIVAARLSRSLTTVIDTLGLDPERRAFYLRQARAAGLPAVLVIMNTPAALCRQRNRDRDRPVPAPVITEQLRRVRSMINTVADEGWDEVLIIDSPVEAPVQPVPPSANDDHPSESGPRLILQISRFPWGEDPIGWLRDLALAADGLGFHGIALMDHLIQIPQVDRAWEPIPEPWVTLGMLCGLDTRLRLGTLVSPVTFREPGIIAKTVATLDALSGGRAFCGLGAGWWLREHQAYGLDFPAAGERLDRLQVTHRDAARAVGARHQGVPRPVRPAARDHLLSPAGRRRADHRRRIRRAPHPADRRRAGRRRQSAVGSEDPAEEDRHPARALRRGRS